eukprot:397175_1
MEFLTMKQAVTGLLIPWVFPIWCVVLSGDAYWIEAWLETAVIIIAYYYIVFWLYRNNYGLLVERFKLSSKDQPPEDKTWLMYMFSCIVLYLMSMPLDAKRFGWSSNIIAAIPYFGVIKWACFVLHALGAFV